MIRFIAAYTYPYADGTGIQHIHMQMVQVYSISPVGAVVLGLARPRYSSGVASVLSYQNKRHISF